MFLLSFYECLFTQYDDTLKQKLNYLLVITEFITILHVKCLE